MDKEKLLNCINKLEQENMQMRITMDRYKKGNSNIIERTIELEQENKQLKERFVKALDKLDKLNEKLKCIFDVGINNAEVSEIKSILKGENNE